MAMERTIFDEDHHSFRTEVRSFIDREIAPHHDDWIEQGHVPRSVWAAAGERGLLCRAAPEAYGGTGVKDFRYDAILGEEFARGNHTGPGFGIHSTIVAPYILEFGTDEQRDRWAPGMVSGDIILAVGMTESTSGSDLNSLSTAAVDDGDAYVVSGAKAFVSNGLLADLIVVSCVTNPEHKQWGISLLAIEKDTPGVSIGEPLDKIGWRAQDTVPLFLDEVRVPKANLIGSPGQGAYLMGRKLDQERLIIAVNAIASARAAIDLTVEFCREREAFGRTIGSFQNTRFRLAEMETEVSIGQVFVDRCIMAWNEGTITAADVAMAKWWATSLQQRTIDQCLQLHGGIGYLADSPIGRAWLDMRWTPIGGGTNEIMKELIGRTMGL